MKDTKKIKLGKLNFYIIDDNYIKYLSQFDRHIAYLLDIKSKSYGYKRLLCELYSISQPITIIFLIDNIMELKN